MCIPVAGKQGTTSSDKATETVCERKKKQRGKERKSRQGEGVLTVESWELWKEYGERMYGLHCTNS